MYSELSNMYLSKNRMTKAEREGYVKITLPDGKQTTISNFIADTWHSDSIEDGIKREAHHITSDKHDNSLQNLLWLTPEEHAKIPLYKYWVYDGNGITRFEDIYRLHKCGKSFATLEALADYFGISVYNLKRAVHPTYHNNGYVLCEVKESADFIFCEDENLKHLLPKSRR